MTSVRDGLQSLATRMGTSADKAVTSSYEINILDQHHLEAAYRTSWVMKKVVRVPAFDAVRKWRQWSGEEDQVQLIVEVEKAARICAQKKLFEASWKARLWGGAAVLIGLRDRDFAEPVNLDRVGIGDLSYLTVLTRRDLQVGDIEQDPREERFGLPKWYDITTETGQVIKIHPSRLVIFPGDELPDRMTGYAAQTGWGDSVLQSVYDACRNLDGTMANVASLVFDAKTDVIKIPNLSELVADPQNEQLLAKRFATARMIKGNHGILLLDSDEEYDTKSYSFGGLDSIADKFMQVASGAADIPMTRLLGMSPGGMNSTGDGDLTNYYDRVQSLQTLELGPSIALLDEIIVRSATGAPMEDVSYEWRPLRQMTEEQIAEIRSKSADALSKIATTGVYGDDEVASVGSQMMNETGLEGLSDRAADDADDLDETDDLELSDAAPRTLYVSRKVKNASDIIAWAKGQGFQTTLPADDLHVTIAFSRAKVDWMQVGSDWEAELTVAEGGPRLMEQFGEARVLLFASSSLSWRHESIKHLGATWDHPEYQPHITISYDPDAPDLKDVEPYTGKIVLGPEVFAEVKEDWAEGVVET